MQVVSSVMRRGPSFWGCPGGGAPRRTVICSVGVSVVSCVKLYVTATDLRIVVYRHHKQTVGILGVALDNRPFHWHVGGVAKDEYVTRARWRIGAKSAPLTGRRKRASGSSGRCPQIVLSFLLSHWPSPCSTHRNESGGIKVSRDEVGLVSPALPSGSNLLAPGRPWRCPKGFARLPLGSLLILTSEGLILSSSPTIAIVGSPTTPRDIPWSYSSHPPTATQR